MLIIFLVIQSFAHCNITVIVKQQNVTIGIVQVNDMEEETKTYKISNSSAQPLQFFIRGKSCSFKNYMIDYLPIGKKKLYVEIGPQPYMSQVR